MLAGLWESVKSIYFEGIPANLIRLRNRLLWHEIYTKNAGNTGIARMRGRRDFILTSAASKNRTGITLSVKASGKS